MAAFVLPGEKLVHFAKYGVAGDAIAGGWVRKDDWQLIWQCAREKIDAAEDLISQ